jgi:hypothetical protein
MSFNRMILKFETKELAQEVVDLYERIIRLRTEARLKGEKPPFDKLSLLLSQYCQANNLDIDI